MAKSRAGGKIGQNMLSGSMNKQVRTFGLKQEDYIFARNAINKSGVGDVGGRVTERANKICAYAPYTIIGARLLEKDWFVIFSTNDTFGEIGYFHADRCEYVRVARSECFGFRKTNLITAVSRPTFDGTFNVYFDDGALNVSRMFNTGNFPFVQNCTTVDGCTTCVDTDVVDCEKLRLESIIQTPCLSLNAGPSIGSILNGSYIAHIAYVVDDQRVTDYFTGSNVLSVFNHSNLSGSLEINFSNLDTNFDEFELVIVSTISEKTVARKIGVYSTRQTTVTIDQIDNTLPVVSLNVLPIVTPVPDRSEAMFTVGDYLTRVNPSQKFDFNYQPLANQIQVYWQSVRYPKDYYKKGGTNVGHMRDEVYAYFIRWIYNTGDKSPSFHIPGRGVRQFYWTDDTGANGGLIFENDPAPVTVNNIDAPYAPKAFEVQNTAVLTSTPGTVLPDGGVVIAEGLMGYHESTELYDDKNPSVWNANIPGFPEYDLCGKPIRHHRMPDNVLISGGATSTLTNHYENGGEEIRILGVRFDNVQPPVDNQGNPIPNVVGYEILRGSRVGQKTVLFKGMLNNTFEYDIPKSLSSKQGLYANYPFNDLRPDPYISKDVDPVTYEPAMGGLQNYTPNDRVNRKHFTFHSPDTMFHRPVLQGDELKIHGAMYGDSRGSFLEPEGHPRHKFITDVSFIASVVVGFAYAIAKMNGTRDIVYKGWSVDPESPVPGELGAGTTGTAAATAVLSAATAAANNLIGTQGALDALSGGSFGNSSTVYSTQNGVTTSSLSSASIPYSGIIPQSIEIVFKDQKQAPTFLKNALVSLGNPMFLGHMSDGIDAFIKVIQAVGAWRQHALQYQALCEYENFAAPYPDNRRRLLSDARYLNAGFFDFGNSHRINHKLRQETTVFKTTADVSDLTGSLQDKSRPPLAGTLSTDSRFDYYLRRASSHYASMKVRLRNQYGQLQSIVQVPATTCMIPIELTSTGTVFGGDTYIGKYSEKNTMYFFDQWLHGEPDGAIKNYFRHRMLEHVAFWMDTDPFDLMEFVQSVPAAIGSAVSSGSIGSLFSNIVTPSDKHCFDRGSNNGAFLVKNAYMYLFQSGVRNFFVETEFNIDMRDWEDEDVKKHYPVLSDLKTMFSLGNIKADNYYKIDRSLSVNFLAHFRSSWAKLQPTTYDPIKAELVYTKLYKRVLYSLPQKTAAFKDNWAVFLPLNYKDFTSDVSCIKPINKTGALIFFKTESPKMLPGVDEMQTTSGAKVTIGDGALWSRQLQSIDNSEAEFQYGSCQNRLSVINTPKGLFYMSTDQGEIFMTNGSALKPIGGGRLREWLNRFLPFQLLLDFPTFTLTDNPVVGIGCQSIYLNDLSVAYFCKKDYRLRTDLPATTTVEHIDGIDFLVNGVLRVKLGDPRFFANASWTLSWDVENDDLISFHDWHPDLSLLGSNVFHTTKVNGLWKHNSNCQQFCNYYGVDYPFEIEVTSDDMFQTNVLRNVQYYLQAFRYSENCYDRYHLLNFNFDQAIIHNSEQVSGILNLILDDGTDPKFSLQYPIVNLNSVDILYSKEEQMYTFNQFWDVTRDRGEFTGTEEQIWITEPNGYIRNLNPANLDYNKTDVEKIKFRHNNVSVRLIRRVVGSVEMVVDLILTNKLNSPR